MGLVQRLGVLSSTLVVSGLLLALLGAGLQVDSLALAAATETINVTTTADELDAGTSGTCSLREAIQAANTDTPVGGCPAGDGADTIVVPAGTYNLTLVGEGEDDNQTGDLDIHEDLTIQGATSSTTIINGNAADRIFHVVGDVTMTVTIADVTVENGFATCSGDFCDAGAGGVQKDGRGQLTITDSTLRDNKVTCISAGCGWDRNVGALYVQRPNDLNIEDSRFVNNQATCSSFECSTGVAVMMINLGSVGDQQASVSIANTLIENNRASCDEERCYTNQILRLENPIEADLFNTSFVNNAVFCDGEDCTGDPALIIEDTLTATLQGVTLDGNQVSCEADSCYVDRMLRFEINNQLLLTDTVITGNRISCVGEPITTGFPQDTEHCESRELISLSNPTTTKIIGLQVVSNSLSCSGAGCETSDIFETDDDDKRYFSLKNSRFVSNTQICTGGVYSDSGNTAIGCDTDRLLYVNGRVETVEVDNVDIISNSLTCLGGGCDTDDVFRVNDFGVMTATHVLATDNLRSCNDDGDGLYEESVVCDTDDLLDWGNEYNSQRLYAQGITATHNQNLCVGSGRSTLKGCDTDEVIRWFAETGTVKDVLVQDNLIRCWGIHCDVGRLIQVDIDYVLLTNLVVDNNQLLCDDDDCTTERILQLDNVVTGTLRDSTVSNNTSSCGGAANCDGTNAYFKEVERYGLIGTGGLITVSNTTVSGNRISGSGAGFVNQGQLRLVHTTIVSNIADIDGNGIGFGGGICNDIDGPITQTICLQDDNRSMTTTVTLVNSIVAHNRDANGPGDCYGVIDSAAYSLIQTVPVTCDITVQDQLILNQDPLVLPLADNGGDSETHALGLGSVAIDYIPDGVSFCGSPDVDQRGVSRPLGDGCDIGAFESNSYTLTVAVEEASLGTVTGSGIDCGVTCTQSYPEQTMVTLTAVPTAGAVLASWSGACSGTADCVVTMDMAQLVTATFAVAQQELTVAVNGDGNVTSDPAGIDCPGDCDETFDHGTMVTLTATADADSAFSGWSGACSGTADCVVTMDSAQDVTATFVIDTYTIYLPTLWRGD